MRPGPHSLPDFGHISHADLGGQPCAQAIQPEPEGELFHAAWEPRALALTLAAGATGAWNIDMSRRMRESLPRYAELSYYEIWIHALEQLLLERGCITAAELASGIAQTPPAALPRVLRPAEVAATLARGSPTHRPTAQAAAFAVGDFVRTRVPAPGHHTRLPRYAWAKTGVIQRVHGAHVWASANAHGLGEQPQWFYTVRFEARDLFGPEAHPLQHNSLEAWESSLEPLPKRPSS